MTKNGVILTVEKLKEKLENDEWKIEGVKDYKPISLFVGNRYYDIYNIEKRDDSVVYYAFDDNLKLYKIIRRGKIDRVIETGATVADIVDVGTVNNPKAFELFEDEDVKSYE